MPRRGSSNRALTDETVRRALLYALQLGMEWEIDRAAYEDGAVVLGHVVKHLERHRKRRAELRTKALAAELVEPIMERLTVEKGGHCSRTETRSALTRWLKRVGISVTDLQVEELLEAPPTNAGARIRTHRERITAKLAEVIRSNSRLVTTSQSDFEKTVAVANGGTENLGRLGNLALLERAASDVMAGGHETLLYLTQLLELDAATGRRILGQLSLQQIDDDMSARREAANLHADGRRAKAALHGTGQPGPATGRAPSVGKKGEARKASKQQGTHGTTAIPTKASGAVEEGALTKAAVEGAKRTE